MKEYTYLIVGNGMTADAAARNIRAQDKSGTIGIVGAEPHEPYFRPPLSKSLWQGKEEDSIWCGTKEVTALDVITGRQITDVDPDEHTAHDDNGDIYRWRKLLLATGGTPNHLPNVTAEGIVYYRTLDDYRTLQCAVQEKGTHIVVVGGGFIGSEISAALTMNDVEVTMVFPESGIGAAIFPKELSDYLTQFYESKGVNVLPQNAVTEITKLKKGYEVATGAGKTIQADLVVAGIGIRPNTDLAEKTGLQVDNGIKVDQFLQTSRPDVYAAGDVANFYNKALDQRLRVEHDDNTQAMGAAAGTNMAGGSSSYDYLPMFYSDLFDLGYEAVGETKSDMDVVTQWEEPGRKGIIFYLDQNLVKGVIFWNVWDMVDSGRKLIAAQKHQTATDLRQWYNDNVGK